MGWKIVLDKYFKMWYNQDIEWRTMDILAAEVGAQVDQLGMPVVPGVVEVLHCPRHPRYRGFRTTRIGCERCWAIFTYQRSIGKREERPGGRGPRKKTYNEIMEENL